MALIMLAMFIAIPIIEIALLIQLGGWIGFWPTLGVVIATAIAGTALIRAQGRTVLQSAISASERGEMPVDPAIDAVSLLLSGALLLTPGLVTDALGFLLLVPPLRRSVARKLFRAAVARGNVNVSMGGATFSSGPSPRGPDPRGTPHPNRRPPTGNGPVIDGDFERMSPDDNAPDETKGSSGSGNPWSGRKR